MGRKKIFMDQVLNEDKCGPETTGLPFSLPAVIDTGEYSFPGPWRSRMEGPLSSHQISFPLILETEAENDAASWCSELQMIKVWVPRQMRGQTLPSWPSLVDMSSYLWWNNNTEHQEKIYLWGWAEPSTESLNQEEKRGCKRKMAPTQGGSKNKNSKNI